jgi:hypothetical protein
MTRSRGRPPRTPRRGLVLCLLCLAVSSRAQAASPGLGAPVRITVTVAGDPDCAPRLRAALAGQLADIAAEVHWSCEARFDAAEPFREGPRTDARARVWVDLSADDEARLILEDTRENRFFLRRLPVANGLDEIGREEIAQVVRSATIAVTTGEAGVLTRAEARVTASEWPAPAPRAPSRAAPMPAPGPSSRATPAPPPTAERVDVAPPATGREPREDAGPFPRRVQSSTPEGSLAETPGSAKPSVIDGVEIGPTWTAQTLAGQIPVAQEIGLSLALAGWGGRVSFWTSAGFRLPAMYDDPNVGVRLTTLSVRAGMAVWTPRSRGVALGLGGGFGGERVWFSPRGNAIAVDPASPDRFDTFAGRVFLAVRLQASARLLLRFDLLCDLATADVHFDFRDVNGVTQRALTEWPLQPGLSLAAAWRWGD